MADIIKQIRDIYPQLSSAKKSAASYFLNHYHALQFATVTELAERIGVSDTTIINLCIDLGFSGYSGFKKAVRADIVAASTGNIPASDTVAEDNTAKVQVLAAPMVQAFSDTFSDTQNCGAITQAAQMLAEARTIYAIGFWSLATLAQDFCLQLRRKGCRAEAIYPSLGDYIDKVLQIAAEDVVVLYDFSRYFTGMNEICQLLKKQGVPIILITDMGPCPCIPFANVSIHCKTPEQGEKFTQPQASMVGCLLVSLCCELLPREHNDYETLREGVFTRFNAYGVIEPGEDYTTRV